MRLRENVGGAKSNRIKGTGIQVAIKKYPPRHVKDFEVPTLRYLWIEIFLCLGFSALVFLDKTVL